MVLNESIKNNNLFFLSLWTLFPFCLFASYEKASVLGYEDFLIFYLISFILELFKFVWLFAKYEPCAYFGYHLLDKVLKSLKKSGKRVGLWTSEIKWEDRIWKLSIKEKKNKKIKGWRQSFFSWEGFGVVNKPRLGTADTAVAEEVGAKPNELAAPAASISSDGSLEFILLTAPPSIAAVESGTSGTGSTVVPPNAITE